MRIALPTVLTPALCGIVLAACIPQAPDSHWTARDWASIGKKRPANPPEIWCYQTIGKADCYTERLPSQDYRLIEGGPVANPQNMAVDPAPVEAHSRNTTLNAAPKPAPTKRQAGAIVL